MVKFEAHLHELLREFCSTSISDDNCARIGQSLHEGLAALVCADVFSRRQLNRRWVEKPLMAH